MEQVLHRAGSVVASLEDTLVLIHAEEHRNIPAAVLDDRRTRLDLTDHAREFGFCFGDPDSSSLIPGLFHDHMSLLDGHERRKDAKTPLLIHADLWHAVARLPRYRVSHLGSEIEVPIGRFTIGRSSACQLALADALVSRTHAALDVRPDGIWIEDLGSRNGVWLNDHRIMGRTRLTDRDRLSIGSHDLVILELPDGSADSQCDFCAAPISVEMEFCTNCAAPTAGGRAPRQTLEAPTFPEIELRTLFADQDHPSLRLEPRALRNENEPKSAPPSEEEPTRYTVLNRIADKALALRRFDEAERVLAKSMEDLLATARASGGLPAARLAEGADYALRLAEGTRREAWIDWVFEIHAATARVMSLEQIELIERLVRHLHYRNAGPIRRCITTARARASNLSRAERFLISRLEQVERVVLGE